MGVGAALDRACAGGRAVEGRVPAALIASDGAMSKQMEKIMQMVNKDAKASPKILEINQNHPMMKKLYTIYKANPQDKILTKIVNNLYTSVLILEGAMENSPEMANTLQDLLKTTVDMYAKGEKK